MKQELFQKPYENRDFYKVVYTVFDANYNYLSDNRMWLFNSYDEAIKKFKCLSIALKEKFSIENISTDIISDNLIVGTNVYNENKYSLALDTFKIPDCINAKLNSCYYITFEYTNSSSTEIKEFYYYTQEYADKCVNNLKKQAKDIASKFKCKIVKEDSMVTYCVGDDSNGVAITITIIKALFNDNVFFKEDLYSET